MWEEYWWARWTIIFEWTLIELFEECKDWQPLPSEFWFGVQLRWNDWTPRTVRHRDSTKLFHTGRFQPEFWVCVLQWSASSSRSLYNSSIRINWKKGRYSWFKLCDDTWASCKNIVLLESWESDRENEDFELGREIRLNRPLIGQNILYPAIWLAEIASSRILGYDRGPIKSD